MNTDRKSERVFEDAKINVKMKLSGLWLAAMFSWIYGDLLRIYSGDFIAGSSIGEDLIASETLWLISAITMIVPGAMVFLSLALKGRTNRLINIVMGVFYTGYNLVGLLGGGYPSAYDKFLIIVGILFTTLVIWFAWRWPKQDK